MGQVTMLARLCGLGRRIAHEVSRIVVICCRVTLMLLVADLAWFGLVNGGLRSSVPGIARAEVLAGWEREMSAEEVALVEASFSTPNASGVRRFVGDPAELRPGSRLSRAFSLAAEREGNALTGIGLVHAERAELGIPVEATRWAYLAQATHDLLSCLGLLAIIRYGHVVTDYLCLFLASEVPRG